MNSWVRFVVLAVGAFLMLFAGPARAAVILHADFEPPTYTLGSVHGQDGWSAIIGSPHQVNNAVVHGGTQSLNGAYDRKDFSAPFSSLGTPWFAEAWCYTQPMAGNMASHFSIGNGLNDHFYIELRGDGQLTFYMSSTIEVRTLGTAALNKWLRFKAEYVAHPYFVRLSVTGDGVDESWVGGMIAAGEPSFLTLYIHPGVNLPDGAGSYWDDILVSNEPPVPTLPNSWGRMKALYR